MKQSERTIKEIAREPLSNGCLTGYLRQRYNGASTISVRVEQGYEIDRPSLLLLNAAEEGDGIEVEVCGSVIPVEEG